MPDPELEVLSRLGTDLPVTDGEMMLLADLLPALTKDLLLAESDAEEFNQSSGVQSERRTN